MQRSEIIKELNAAQDIIVNPEMTEMDRLFATYLAIDSLKTGLVNDEMRADIAEAKLSLESLGPKLRRQLYPCDDKPINRTDTPIDAIGDGGLGSGRPPHLLA